MLESVNRICGIPGLGMSPKRITVSTAGIAKAIKRLGDDGVKFNLALSLHAANDEKRSEIMAINDTNNLQVLAEALQYFHEKTGTRVTFEYIIFKDFNDDIQDARDASSVKTFRVRLTSSSITLSTTESSSMLISTRLRGLLSSLRTGISLSMSADLEDIDAACGQLANKNEKGMTPGKGTCH